jgi:hypothetical protein
VVSDFDITPEEARHGQVGRDADQPMLAAHWLTCGHDSPLLRELAGLTRSQAIEARHMFDAVLAELGHPVVSIDSPYHQLPLRGCLDRICWAVEQMDTTHPPTRPPSVSWRSSATCPTCGRPAEASS